MGVASKDGSDGSEGSEGKEGGSDRMDVFSSIMVDQQKPGTIDNPHPYDQVNLAHLGRSPLANFEI